MGPYNRDFQTNIIGSNFMQVLTAPAQTVTLADVTPAAVNTQFQIIPSGTYYQYMVYNNTNRTLLIKFGQALGSTTDYSLQLASGATYVVDPAYRGLSLHGMVTTTATGIVKTTRLT